MSDGIVDSYESEDEFQSHRPAAGDGGREKQLRRLSANSNKLPMGDDVSESTA